MKTYLLLFLFLFSRSLTAQMIADFEEYQLQADTFDNGSDGNGGFSSGDIFLPNDYSADFDAWTGWALSSKIDTTTPGFFNQYSCVAGSGFESLTYAVAFALEPTTIKLINGPMKMSGLYVCNGTYPYLSMRDGDSFSKKFGGPSGSDPDFFVLTIKKFKDGQLSTDSVDFYLADFRSDNQEADYIVNRWTYLDLSSLGEADSLQFNLFSSDNGIFGMNTPAYFCIDQVVTEDLSTPSFLSMQNDSKLDLLPNPATEFLEIKSERLLSARYFIYDQVGQMVFSSMLINGQDILDVQDYLPGLYYLILENASLHTASKFIKY